MGLFDFDLAVSIEGYPVIIRFKTSTPLGVLSLSDGSIEGYPVIIRFKTNSELLETADDESIEGYPVIIRFKTVTPIT